MGNTRRHLLYSGYNFLKAMGLVRLNRFSSDYANILMFHRVNSYDFDSLTTPTHGFEETIREISTNYRAISLRELIVKIKNKTKIESNSVAVTFDDGYKDNFENAAPILLKYGIPATFFVTSGYINSQRVFSWDREQDSKFPLMSWDDVRSLSRMGFDIGSHTINHVNLGKVSSQEAREELYGSKAQIEDEVGKPVNTFAYPFGRKDCIRKDVIDIVKEAGYDCCCSGYGGKVKSDSDIYNLNRISMYPNLIELKMELDGFMTYYDGKMSINMLRPRSR